jgi:ABC-type transporter MlaC component
MSEMGNKDQVKIAEVINQCIINKYMKNIAALKTRSIKLYSAMPYTGAPNISDAQKFSMIEDYTEYLKNTYVSPNN